MNKLEQISAPNLVKSLSPGSMFFKYNNKFVRVFIDTFKMLNIHICKDNTLCGYYKPEKTYSLKESNFSIALLQHHIQK